MWLSALFALSGLIIAALLLAKRFEEKRRRAVFILEAISKGDERARKLHHRILQGYSQGKENLIFLLQKQLPLRSKNVWNKFHMLIKEWSDRYMGEMRDARILSKKQEGLSEFFKNISDIEKGAGEINEYMPVDDPSAYLAEEKTKAIEPLLEKAPAPAKKKRAPRKKKIPVIEVE